jgi:hypothetical protein
MPHFAGHQMPFAPGYQQLGPQQQDQPIQLPPGVEVPEICPWLVYCDHHPSRKGRIEFASYAETLKQEAYHRIDQFTERGVEDIARWTGIKPAIIDLLQRYAKEDMRLLSAGHFTMN